MSVTVTVAPALHVVNSLYVPWPRTCFDFNATLITFVYDDDVYDEVENETVSTFPRPSFRCFSQSTL